MKEQLINEIQCKMLPYLNNEQLLQLRNVLDETKKIHSRLQRTIFANI